MSEKEIELRDELKWFAQQMESVLRGKDHKGGWLDESTYWLFDRLKEESAELFREVEKFNARPPLETNPPDLIEKRLIKEAVDVANFALMLADIAYRRAKNRKGGINP